MITLFFLTGTVAAYTIPSYTDDFARNFMFPLSAAAYSDEPQLCVENLFLNASVTGHSLGGSLASLAASYIVASGMVKWTKMKVVTFGQPRTGDYSYAISHNAQLGYSYRVVHWRDIVPHLPNVGYNHHRREVHYTSEMLPDHFTICEGYNCFDQRIPSFCANNIISGNEEKKCSNGLLFPTSYDDHTHYFGKYVSKFGQSGCV
ncbi:unnamed protein product [Strongylus vulgaris]|uniref:Fungal lipase-type domain-containing protein n=1 Tax=Strongylus vulgaris TaxID=40348 RepID=A0A3P7JFT9_STRVU|nr:unnamed protein product [Strongylus vulgaris]